MTTVRKVIGKVGDRTLVRIEYYITRPKLVATKDIWEDKDGNYIKTKFDDNDHQTIAEKMIDDAIERGEL